MKTIKVMLLIFLTLGMRANVKAQQLEALVVDKITAGSEIPQSCKPDNVIIYVYSGIEDLQFESNVDEFLYSDHRKAEGLYILCHAGEKFKLTIKGKKFKSETIELFDLSQKRHALRVSSEAVKGKFIVNTVPAGAEIHLKDNPGGFPSGESITLTAGKWPITIEKAGYQTIDTSVLVPSEGEAKLNITLVAEFATIRLDILPQDLSEFTIYPTLQIDSAQIDMNDLLDKSKLKSFSDKTLNYYKIHEGGLIPIPAGTRTVSVLATGFKRYTSILRATESIVTPLSVRLEPIYGFLTVLAGDANSSGASVIVDGKEVGKVPLFKQKIRTGGHTLQLQKAGFLTKSEEYPIEITNNENTDFNAQMSIFRRFVVKSTPDHAEVLVDGLRKGFAPTEIELPEGQHTVVIRLAGHLDVVKKINIDINSPQGIDTMNMALLNNFPLSVSSEKKGLSIVLSNEAGEVVSNNLKTNSNVPLPYGDYTLDLYNADSLKGFSGKITHNGTNKVKAPFYSRGAFSILNADYQFNSLTDDGKYGLLASGSFGRFSIFRGLSTSILHASLFQYKGEETDKLKFEKDTVTVLLDHPSNLFAFTAMFLNAELRVGGSILRNLDIAAVGAFYYYPSLTGLLAVDHFDGTEMFFGIEVSTRISHLNVNFKIGQEMFNGNYNYIVNKDASDTKDKFNQTKQAMKLGKTVFSVGFTLGGDKVYKSNNMFRLWKKPLGARY